MMIRIELRYPHVLLVVLVTASLKTTHAFSPQTLTTTPRRIVIGATHQSLRQSSALWLSQTTTPTAARVNATDHNSSPKAAAADDHSNAAIKDVFAPPPLTPWPFASPVIATGDYVNDLCLEGPLNQEHRPLYAQQASLPSLPVPTLQETLPTLQPTVLPLAQNDQERQDFLQACDKFTSQAAVLQQRLEQRDAEYASKKSSWLQGWWQPAVYLQYRQPLPHYVSYFLMVPDDGTLQNYVTNNNNNDNLDTGVLRGGAILHAVAESRLAIGSGTQLPDTAANNAPLCSVGLKYAFHACRIPQPLQDVYHLYDPSLYTHAIVACRGHFFAVDIIDDKTHQPLPLPLLVARLQYVRQWVDASHDDAASLPQLGWCTSLNRDDWAQARQDLLDASKDDRMQNALAKMESAMFVLNLDDEEPASLCDAAEEFWHGTVSSSGANRWFDKPMQLLVTRNGHVAYQGEHSMLDAAPVIGIIRKILKTTYAKLAKKYTKDDQVSLDIISVQAGVQNIFTDCWSDEALLAKAQILADTAQRHHAELSAQFDCKAISFDEFGKIKAKQWGYDGPLLAQLAIQMAAYQMLGNQKTLIATYEAASTRAFLHGRTETTRPVSDETLTFVQAMINEKNTASLQKKKGALDAVAQAIGTYQTKASSGKGVDRHLFGLSNLLKESEASPDLYQDPLFQRAKTFRLSTSSVVFTPGFGPVKDDGLGIGFNAEKDAFIFTATSLKSNEKYVERFTTLVQEALRDIGQLLDATATTDE